MRKAHIDTRNRADRIALRCACYAYWIYGFVGGVLACKYGSSLSYMATDS